METLTSFHIAAYPCWVRAWTSHGHTHAQGNTPPIAIYEDQRIIVANGPLVRQGLQVGESLDRARVLFPGASFYPHDPHLDSAVWEDLLYLLADVSPRLRSLGTGWALLDPFDVPTLLGVNRTLRGQIGIAPMTTNAPRFSAMLAALQARPGEAITLSSKDRTTFYTRTSIRHLSAFGFDDDLLERLALFGLTTIARLLHLTRRHLKVQFGAVGAALYDLLHPKGTEPPIPLFQPPPILSAEYTFELPAIEPAELTPVLDHLLAQLAGRLGAFHTQLLTVRLSGGGPEGTRAARRLLKVPTGRLDHLRVVAHTVLDELMKYGDAATRHHAIDDAPQPVDAIRIKLGGLVERSGMQGGLFEHRPAVYEAVKTIHRRFPGRLLRAVITDPHAYIPETGVRFEPYPIGPHMAHAQMPTMPVIISHPGTGGPVSPLPVMLPPTITVYSGRIVS